MEDLILVTGCTLVTSWGIGAFLDNTQDAAVSLRSQASDGGGATFDWREIHPSVACQNSDQDPVRPLRHIPASFADSSCTALKGEYTPESMRVHQGLSSKAQTFIDPP